MSESTRLSAMIIGLLIFAGCCFIWVASELLTSDSSPSVVLKKPVSNDKAQISVLASTRANSQANDQAFSFLSSDFLRESLSRLEAEGSDLRLPMPSRHQIRAENRQVANKIASWGKANGFAPSPVRIEVGQDGVEFFDVDLVFSAVPDVAKIQMQGAQIRAGVEKIEGAVYFTWLGEIVQPLPSFTNIEHSISVQESSLD